MILTGARSVGALAVDDSYSLPLDGFYRVGRLMPIRLEPRLQARTIRLPFAVPLDVDARVGGVAGILMLGDRSADPAGNPLVALTANEKVVACEAALEPMAARLFDGLRLHFVRPPSLSRPICAWESLDAWIGEAPFPPKMDVESLVGNGLTIVVHGKDKPADGLPWQRVEDAWVLRPIGPAIEQLISAVYLPVQHWPRRLDNVQRMRILGVAVLASLVGVATLLYHGRGAVVLQAGVVALCIAGLLLWRRGQSSLEVAGGAIVVRRSTAEQVDHWQYVRSVLPTSTQTSDRVVPSGLEQVEKISLRGHFRNDGDLSWTFKLSANQAVAEVNRRVTVPQAAQPSSQSPSPLRGLAESYAGQKSTVESIAPAFARDWPGIQIKASSP